MKFYTKVSKKSFVGTRAQNNVLGLGPWALSEDTNKSEEEQITIK